MFEGATSSFNHFPILVFLSNSYQYCRFSEKNITSSLETVFPSHDFLQLKVSYQFFLDLMVSRIMVGSRFPSFVFQMPCCRGQEAQTSEDGKKNRPRGERRNFNYFVYWWKTRLFWNQKSWKFSLTMECIWSNF